MNAKLGAKGAGRLVAKVAITGAMVAIPMAVLAGPALADTTPGVTNVDRDHHDRDHHDNNNGQQWQQPWQQPQYPQWQQPQYPQWQQPQWQPPVQQPQAFDLQGLLSGLGLSPSGFGSL